MFFWVHHPFLLYARAVYPHTRTQGRNPHSEFFLVRRVYSDSLLSPWSILPLLEKSSLVVGDRELRYISAWSCQPRIFRIIAVCTFAANVEIFWKQASAAINCSCERSLPKRPGTTVDSQAARAALISGWLSLICLRIPPPVGFIIIGRYSNIEIACLRRFSSTNIRFCLLVNQFLPNICRDLVSFYFLENHIIETINADKYLIW